MGESFELRLHIKTTLFKLLISLCVDRRQMQDEVCRTGLVCEEMRSEQGLELSIVSHCIRQKWSWDCSSSLKCLNGNIECLRTTTTAKLLCDSINSSRTATSESCSETV